VTQIQTLLVANRGEIARRIIRTSREMGLRTVAVFSDPDQRAPFVGEADVAVYLPGSTPADTYLDVAKIIGAARTAGADALHPGYGFLSESPALASACADAGMTFVGPPAGVMARAASKIEVKELMTAAGVPVVPGAPIDATSDPARLADQIGWPILVKADMGGGGRGMRVVESRADLEPALDSSRREAESAFGTGTVFLERYIEEPRHVEVQVVGDSHGELVHLFERDCSVQRRYQKLVEESPSPAVDPTLRDELVSAALTAAKAIAYVGAGTVEFLLDRRGTFYFLEVNARLQVEHPVTEMVTGLDLVKLQLLVASGEHLPPEATSASLSGHAVEARVYAEDVAAGFLPTAGTLERFELPAGPAVRVDAGYESGSVVPTHYDALLAKVIAWAPTREQAVERLASALERSRIHGVRTNRALLVAALRHPEFEAGDADTAFLTRHPPHVLAASARSASRRRVHAVVAALSAQAQRRRHAGVLASIPSGWRNVASGMQEVVYEDEEGPVEVGYRFRRDGVDVEVDGTPLKGVALWELSADVVEMTADGLRRRYAVEVGGPRVSVDSELGTTTWEEVDRFPLPTSSSPAGSLLAPLPGSVSRVLVDAGDAVDQGQVLVVLEAMKMEHPVIAPHPGTVVDVRVGAGDQVETGTVLAVVADPAPSSADDRPEGRHRG
jgi:acyl-CoA carboxylase subunit alpha